MSKKNEARKKGTLKIRDTNKGEMEILKDKKKIEMSKTERGNRS